ncbi:MAG: hypothetical protein V7K40_29795 [Nostoc sp.]
MLAQKPSLQIAIAYLAGAIISQLILFLTQGGRSLNLAVINQYPILST